MGYAKVEKIDTGWMLGNHFALIINLGLAMCAYLFVSSKKVYTNLTSYFSADWLLRRKSNFITWRFLGLATLTIFVFIALLIMLKNKKLLFDLFFPFGCCGYRDINIRSIWLDR